MNEIEMTLHAIAGTQDSDRSMLLLKEKNGERILPIMMSSRRAMTLMMRSKFPIPMPLPASVPDAALMVMSSFDVSISRIVLTHIHNGTFFCRIVAEREGEEKTIEMCPATDGLILAVDALRPIMIQEDLLEAQYMHKTGENSFAININLLTRQMLEEALKHAVESENYEAASHLRDELAKRSEKKE